MSTPYENRKRTLGAIIAISLPLTIASLGIMSRYHADYPEETLYFISILATAAITGFLAFYAWHQRQVTGAISFMLLEISQCTLTLAEGLSIVSHTQSQALLFFNARYLPGVIGPVLLLIFALEYTGRKSWLSKKLISALFFIPLITQALLWISSLHGLWVVQDVSFHLNGPFLIADTTTRIPAMGFMIHSIYLMLVTLMAVILIVVNAWHQIRPFRWQAILLVSGMLIPILASIIPTFNLNPQARFNPLVQSMAVGAILVAADIFRFQLLGKTAESKADTLTRTLGVESARSMVLFGLIFTLMVAGLSITGFYSYKNYEKKFREEVEHQLAAIAELKVNDLANWRKERLGDAAVLYGDAAFAKLVQHVFENPADLESQEQLNAWMETIQTYQYDRVFLLNTEGVERYSAPIAPEPVAAHLKYDAAEALRLQKIIFLDFHKDSNASPIQLAMLIPIINEQKDVGVLVLQIDSETYLYPYINQWPTASETGETLLVHRDGEDVLFLNDLKFKNDTALNLRIPLANIEMPAVQAVLGKRGILDGVDYRGEPVLAYIHEVPDSPWLLIAKLDRAEAFAPFLSRAKEIILLFITLLLTAGACLLALWRQQRLQYYQSQYAAVDLLRKSEEQYRELIELASDGIFITDKNTRYIEANPSGCSMLGYTREEILSKKIADLVAPDELSTAPLRLEELQEGKTLITERKLLRKDGSLVPVEISARMFPDGRFQSIFRDITERRHTEDALRRSEALLSEAQRVGRIGYLEWTAPGKDMVCSEELLRIFEMPPHVRVISQKIIASMIHPEDLGRLYELDQEVFARHAEMNYEYRILLTGGRMRWLHQQARITYGENGSPVRILGIIQDITDRKIAEQALKISEENYRDLVENSQDLICTHDLDGNLLSVNEAAVKLTGYPRETLLQMNLKDALGPNGAKQFAAYLKQVKSKGAAQGLMKVQIANGEFRIWAYNNTLRTDGATGPIVRGSARDITERKLAEDALNESEERFHKAFRTSPVGMSITTSDGRYIDANDAFSELTGFSHEELVNQTSLQLNIIDPEQRQAYTSLIGKKGSIYNREILLRHKSGEPRVALGSMEVIELNHVPCILSTAIDITERKQTEDELARYTARLEEAEKHAGLGSWEFDVTSGQGWWSKQMYRMFDLEVSDSVPNYDAYLEQIHPDDRPHVLDVLAKMSQGEEPLSEEYRSNPRHGAIRTFAPTVYAQRDEHGKLKKFIGTLLDITQHKRAEEALRMSEEKHRTVVNQAIEGIAIAQDQVIKFSNSSFANMLGYTMEEIEGYSFTKLIPQENIESILERYQSRLAGRQVPQSYESILMHKNGNRLPVDINASLIQYEGREADLVIVRDITERKQSELLIHQYANELELRVEERTAELVHANRAKDEFLANMSHELRTPLNGILGFSETLLEGIRGPMNEAQGQAVEMIHASGQHLLGLINDILDVSKIESGKFELQPEILAVNDICRSSLVFIKQLANQKSITVEYSSSPAMPTIHADPRRLKQILVNLLNNAVKFTPDHGNIKLEVEGDAKAGRMRFSVIDTGIGISADDLQKLFKPFVQVDSSLSRQYEGSGLGLTLVKKMVEMHGGSVEAQSEVGQGSRFGFMLPWDPTLDNNSDQQLPGVVLAKHDPVTVLTPIIQGKILMAEDNEANIMIVKDYLEGRGYQVFVAHDGEEVFTKAVEDPPDLILMDIQMPRVNGFEATQRLRADPRFATVPIIALTAFAMSGDRERCLQAGMNEYLSKPVSLKALGKIVEQFLSHPANLYFH